MKKKKKDEERINFLCVFVYFVGGGGDADGSYLAGRAVAGCIYINKQTLGILSFGWKVDVDDIIRPQKMFSANGFIFETRDACTYMAGNPPAGQRTDIIPCFVGINFTGLVDSCGNCKSTFKKCYKNINCYKTKLIVGI